MWRQNKLKLMLFPSCSPDAQPYITTFADLPSRARGLYFGKIPHLHTYLVYTSGKISGESAHLGRADSLESVSSTVKYVQKSHLLANIISIGLDKHTF